VPHVSRRSPRRTSNEWAVTNEVDLIVMADAEDLVSDAEREEVVRSLRDGLLAGRLTLEEFSERVEIAYGARIGGELARARAGLPGRWSASVIGERGRPVRVISAFLGHVAIRGRLRLRRRTVVASAFADLDLDLREADLDSPHTSVTIALAFGNADVYVPEGVRVSVGGLGVFGHRRDWGHDTARINAPSIRVRAISVFGTVDVWRVPPDMEGGYGEIFRQLQGQRRRLPA